MELVRVEPRPRHRRTKPNKTGTLSVVELFDDCTPLTYSGNCAQARKSLKTRDRSKLNEWAHVFVLRLFKGKCRFPAQKIVIIKSTHVDLNTCSQLCIVPNESADRVLTITIPMVGRRRGSGEIQIRCRTPSRFKTLINIRRNSDYRSSIPLLVRSRARACVYVWYQRRLIATFVRLRHNCVTPTAANFRSDVYYLHGSSSGDVCHR